MYACQTGQADTRQAGMLPLMEEAACAEFIIVGQLAADTRSAGTTVTFLYHGKAQLNYRI